MAEQLTTPHEQQFVSRYPHAKPEDGRCAMEWVAYLAGERHSDRPQCASPVLTEFLQRFNDVLADNERQKLRPYLARTVGTRDDGLDERRSWMAADWLIRTYAPSWLSLAGLEDAAMGLRELPPLLAGKGDPGREPGLPLVVAVEESRRLKLARAMDHLVCAKARAATTVADARTDWVRSVTDADQAAARAAEWVANWVRDRCSAQLLQVASWHRVLGCSNKTVPQWMLARDQVGQYAAHGAWRAAGWETVDDALRPTVEALQASLFELLDQMMPTG